MSLPLSTKPIHKTATREQRLESIRPFTKKFQYQQLPLQKSVKPVENAGQAPVEETPEQPAQESL